MNQILLISDTSIEQIFKDCRIENGNSEAMKRALYSISKNTQENLINYYEHGKLPSNIERQNGLQYIKTVALQALRKKYTDLIGYEFTVDKSSPNYELGVKNFVSELYNYMKEYPYADYSFATNYSFEDFHQFFGPIIREMIDNLSADSMEIFAHRYGCIDGIKKSSHKIVTLLSFDASPSKILDIEKKIYRQLPNKMWRYYYTQQRQNAIETATTESEAKLINEEFKSLPISSTPEEEIKAIESEKRFKL